MSFKKRTEEVSEGIDGVLSYLDEIFIQGKIFEDHNLKLNLSSKTSVNFWYSS